MPKVSQSHVDARRRQILDAATTCFSREGFHRATMQDIVAESGLSPGAIYNYFASKEDIVEALAEERHDRENAVIAAARKKKGLAPVLQEIQRAFFGSLEDPKERRRRRVSIQLWAEAQRSPRIRKIVRRGIDGPRRLLARLVADAQRRRDILRDLDPDAVARFMIAAYQGFVLQLEWDDKAPIEPYVAVLDLFLGRLSLVIYTPEEREVQREPQGLRGHLGRSVATAHGRARRREARAGRSSSSAGIGSGSGQWRSASVTT